MCNYFNFMYRAIINYNRFEYDLTFFNVRTTLQITYQNAF